MAKLFALVRPTRTPQHPVPEKSHPAYAQRRTMRQDTLPDPPK
ncbi:hypothetical protein [Paraprevotella clara]|nr:hypothetical protein [Paraprevotella clara]